MRPAHSQRSVHAVRDGGEHCASPEWQSAVAVNILQAASRAKSVWVRPAHSQRSVHAVRDGGEHCASPEWQSAVAVNIL
ncbi:hypothetical protein ACX1F8_16280, partial [Yersinia enterocolitica]